MDSPVVIARKTLLYDEVENGTSVWTTLVVFLGAAGSSKIWSLCGKYELQHTMAE